MLHFFLMKLYPIAYERREVQALEEEKVLGYFSPQFKNPTSESDDDSGHKENSEILAKDENRSPDNPKQSCDENSVEEKGSPENKVDEKHEHVSVADVPCVACKQLLIRPVVLNCGHVYCRTCIPNLDDGLLKCQVCSSVSPSGIPQTCKELDQFLEEKFPVEYLLKKDAVQDKETLFEHENASTSSDSKPAEQIPSRLSQWVEPDSKVHAGVGCDSCGMYPIIGERYRCKDCVEKIGFDLCGDCYKTRSKLPGRFNQQHTPDHEFELIKLRKRKLKMIRLEDGSRALVFSDDDDDGDNEAEDSENRSAAVNFNDMDAQEILNSLISVNEPSESPEHSSDADDDDSSNHLSPPENGADTQDDTESTN
jgi:hypothetical protein